MKKRILVSVVIGIMAVFSLTACGDNNKEAQTESTEKAATSGKKVTFDQVDSGRIHAFVPTIWSSETLAEEMYDSASVTMTNADKSLTLTVATYWYNASATGCDMKEDFKNQLLETMGEDDESKVNLQSRKISGLEFCWADYVESTNPSVPRREYFFETAMRESTFMTALPYEQVCMYVDMAGDFAGNESLIEQVLDQLIIDMPEGF